jgi:hypothetical protein
MSKTYDTKFIDLLKSVKNKRPKTIISHILEHGYITTEEIQRLYGYTHPPRAVRDVRERGIPIETYTIKNLDGRSIGAYRFGDPKNIHDNIAHSSGRSTLSKTLKELLIQKYGSKCFIYAE